MKSQPRIMPATAPVPPGWSPAGVTFQFRRRLIQFASGRLDVLSNLCLGALLCLVAPPEAAGQISVPGRIEAENYDPDGPGQAFYDNSAGNSGGVHRTDDVDIEATSDSGGGYNVGWIASGEWLVYTLNVPTSAVYQISFRVASANGPGNIHVALDGIPLCSAVTPLTGGWQTWQTVVVSNIVMPAGQRRLRLYFAVGGQNLNYIQISRQRDLTGNFLRASGQQIVDAQGHNVVLRGMGLGNWMLQEPYMMGVSGLVPNQQQLKLKLAELVGTNHTQTFYASWLTNYMRAPDVAALAAAGFNAIRLPLHYNLFTLPIELEPVAGQDTWLTNGFRLVDELLTWCAAHQVYLILDMHACPGGQGHDQPISDYNPPAPSLWEHAANRSKLVALWRQIAARYSDEPWIGGYDLINEPNWTFEGNPNLNGCGDQTNAPLRQLLVDITAAIRQVDTNHLIILEGNCWAGNYNGILPPWDDNLLISFHKYWDQPTAASLQPWVDRRNQWNLPVWLGESGENSNEWFRDVVRHAESANIGWAWWPWKKIGTIAGPVIVSKPAGYQAILDYWNNSGPRPSTNNALNALLALAQAARFENCVVHPDVIDALLRPDPQGATLPFKSHLVPGVIFAVDYDLGRPGEAYFDVTTNSPYNSGSSYRNDSVDIEVCTDSSPSLGHDVGWLDPGDWMKYTVAIPIGPFAITARVAANGSGGRFYVEVAGTNVTGLVNVPATGGWQSWVTLPPRLFTNASPANSFRVVVDTGGFNLNWLRFTSLLPPAPTGLVATANSAQVNLSWQSVAGASSYKVSRVTAGGSNYVTIAHVGGTTYADAAVTNGTTVHYVVAAGNSYGESPLSSPASVEVPFPKLAVSFSPSTVRLSWSNSASSLLLRTTTSLSPPVTWLAVTNPAALQDGVWRIDWSSADAVRFFRLATE